MNNNHSSGTNGHSGKEAGLNGNGALHLNGNGNHSGKEEGNSIIANFTSREAGVIRENEHLQRLNELLSHINDNLEKDNAILKQENDKLLSRIDNLLSVNDNLQKEIDNANRKIDNILSGNEQRQQENDIRQSENEIRQQRKKLYEDFTERVNSAFPRRVSPKRKRNMVKLLLLFCQKHELSVKEMMECIHCSRASVSRY